MCQSYDFDVVIVGGGIAGLATALGLYNAGIRNICVFEKAQSLRPVGAAIGLFPNGLRALRAISPTVHDRVVRSSILSDRRIMHNLDNEVVLDSEVGTEAGARIVYLVWYLLQQYMSEELAANDSTILKLGTSLESFSQEIWGVTVRVVDRGGSQQSVKCRMLVGADGIWSKVRRELFGQGDGSTADGDCTQIHYHGKIMFRAVLPVDAMDAGVCPPAGISNSWAGDEEGKLFAFRETASGIATITAMAKFAEPDVRASPEEKKQRLKEVFAKYPEKVHHIIDSTEASSIFENAVYDIDVVPRWSQGRVVIIGDAAHAMTPGLGQGANQGLEDACELVHYVQGLLPAAGSTEGAAVGPEMEAALEAFWQARRSRVVEVHAGSRARTAQVNKSTVDTRKNPVQVINEDYASKVYGWQPSKLGDAATEANNLEAGVRGMAVA